MSESPSGRAERIARYKEERRAQLAARFGSQNDVPSPTRKRDGGISSGSEGPRTTRASRLRAAAAAAPDTSITSTTSQRSEVGEKTPTSQGRYYLRNRTANRPLERDKSGKRKSNLNRSLTCEEVPHSDTDENRAQRRRRRQLASSSPPSLNGCKTKSDTCLTASSISPTSSPITASSTARLTGKKSDLGVHMENARRGAVPSYSEMGRKAVTPPRNAVLASSPKLKLPVKNSNCDSKVKIANKENIRCDNDSVKSSEVAPKNKEEKYVNFSQRMDELTQFAKESLARIEHLQNKSNNKEEPSAHGDTIANVRVRKTRIATSKSDAENSDPSKPSSILKKKSFDEPIEHYQHQHHSLPVSILKRKSIQDELKSESNPSCSSNTPPVTFSPSVVEPSPTNRKQGILKKRRSLDESQVLRHRSYSPDMDANVDSPSILKNQRRSSLEEINRVQSPDPNLHGILKRKTSRTDDDATYSLNSPQGILKRKSGSNSAGFSTTVHHVSIATAVILAAAGGAEIILQAAGETVRPILKKKSFSEEHPFSDLQAHDLLKPILKKKSSTDTDDSEERPKKPILKLHRNSSDNEVRDAKPFKHIYHQNSSDSSSERDVKPILKQSHRDEHVRPKLTFLSKPEGEVLEAAQKPRNSRRPNTICGDFNLDSRCATYVTEDRDMSKPRPLSDSELVLSFEKKPAPSTGAVPKKSSLKRYSDRYRTQPVTHHELEASRRFIRTPSADELRTYHPLSSSACSTTETNKSFELSPSVDNDSVLNSVLSSASPDSGLGHKLSSDSAFQSLGDCLELEQEIDEPAPKTKMEHSKLELQMKAIAEEAKRRRLGKGTQEVSKFKWKSSDRNSPRFQTQPVTVDEVHEASRLNENEDAASDGEDAEPSNLSLSERIKMFNMKVSEERSQKRDVPRRRLPRFQTQPVTSEEVESARYIPPDALGAMNDDISPAPERKGILKSTREQREVPKSALKRSGSDSSKFISSSPKPILKYEASDFANDEGISSESVTESDKSSDGEDVHTPKGVTSVMHSDKFGVTFSDAKNKGDKLSPRYLDVNDESTPLTSDGESSGGREVQSIMNKGVNRRRAKERPFYDYSISKSRSQGALGNNEVIKENTSAIQRSSTASAMAIAELQAKLQRSGESDWKKRHMKVNTTSEELKNLYNDEKHSEKPTILAKKDELDASSQKWRSRVEKNDAEQFTVLGRMQEISDVPNLNISASDKNKRTPNLRRFRGKEGGDVSSLPSSPSSENCLSVKRSFSVPGSKENSVDVYPLQISGKKVAIIQPDDETFKTFFKSVDTKRTAENIALSLDDLDSVTRETKTLLVQKKNVKVQRRRGATRNPVKSLATNVEIQNEYTEIVTGAAEREEKRLNIAKLQKNSHLAIEALAGLASSEDFTSISLKKSSGPSLPYKNPMLLQIKGRRHIQTRLVEPNAESINQGDNFILVTPTALYNYVGKYSNIIEQSRAVDIASHILQKRDLGCKTDKIVTLTDRTTTDASKFWKLLGKSSNTTVVGAGHPDEDELYETRIIDTNMVYELKDDELVPYTEYWGTIPKIKMLEPSKVIVFDFGSEMYVWSGKTANPDEKKLALKLAKEMWDEGYNYSECTVCPINVASLLGNRPESDVPFKSQSRPAWGLFAKITQHAETILFKEKFLDWPDYSKVIKVKSKDDKDKPTDASFDIQPCDTDEMLENPSTEPDTVIENTHLGRGDQFYDEETRRLFEFNTLEVTMWRILENTYEKLDTLGQFYDGDSYILRWRFRMTVMGRELSGKPSKYAQSGRDRYVYFYWQGIRASVNEKGAAALLTVELDSESAPHVRVTQSAEPPVFLRLFEGGMVVHTGKRRNGEAAPTNRLFILRGECADEAFLSEVPCSMRQLRSRTSFVLVNNELNTVTVWHGCKSSSQTRKVVKQAAEKIIENKPSEFLFGDGDVSLDEVEEGLESMAFKSVLGKKSELYYSLLKNKQSFEYQLRLFHLSSTLGSFKAVEIFCPHRSEHVSPYPFLQTDLYSASQPALFMIDNGFELWLWQGWWPEREDDVDVLDQTGSGAIRWQYERRAAMQTAVNYWHKKHGTSDKPVPAYLVWAGLEPLEFTNLFPTWNNRDDVAELNINEGKKAGDAVLVEKELAILTRTTYPLVQLQQRPLPEGVDPTHLEVYLSAEDFEESFSMTKEEFTKLPSWRQTDLKKENGLF